MTRTQGGGYSAQTRGVLTSGLLQSCTFTVPAGSSRLVIYVGGDAVRVTSGAVGHYVPAGGWWALPLQAGEQEVTVVPVARGGDPTLTLSPSLELSRRRPPPGQFERRRGVDVPSRGT